MLVNSADVFLIDFDHAKVVNLTPSEIRDRYVRRWRRAVIKHSLPEELSELLCAGIKKRNFSQLSPSTVT